MSEVIHSRRDEAVAKSLGYAAYCCAFSWAAAPDIIKQVVVRNVPVWRASQERLGYTKMTMTRAFDELEAAGLGDVSIEGRQRCLRFQDGLRDVWQKAAPLLRSPVKQQHHIRRTTQQRIGVSSGLSALARYSMLAAPSIPVVAVSSNQWKALQNDTNLAKAATDDPQALGVQVWSYDPELLSSDGFVDCLSLFLSLRDNDDERVEGALEEMMEAVQW